MAIKKYLFTLLCLIYSFILNADDFIQEYKATYQVSWKGLEVGISTQELRKLANGEYILRAITKPRVKFLPFYYEEVSRFKWFNHKIHPLYYHQHLLEGKRHKIGHLKFEKTRVSNAGVPDIQWNKVTARQPKLPDAWEYSFKATLLDRLTYTQQLRHDLKCHQLKLDYTIAEIDKLKNYHFIVKPKTTLITPMGKISVVPVEHVSSKGHITQLWLAPEFEYLPVKMIQIRKGRVIAKAVIKTFKIYSKK